MSRPEDRGPCLAVARLADEPVGSGGVAGMTRRFAMHDWLGGRGRTGREDGIGDLAGGRGRLAFAIENGKLKMSRVANEETVDA